MRGNYFKSPSVIFYTHKNTPGISEALFDHREIISSEIYLRCYLLLKLFPSFPKCFVRCIVVYDWPFLFKTLISCKRNIGNRQILKSSWQKPSWVLEVSGLGAVSQQTPSTFPVWYFWFTTLSHVFHLSPTSGLPEATWETEECRADCGQTGLPERSTQWSLDPGRPLLPRHCLY